jgi:imidazole glycerol-phosphate synthase subunit HisH
LSAPTPVRILDYGMGNIRSIRSALQAVGAEVEVSEEVGGERLVVPGCGSFAEAVERLGPRMDALRAFEGELLGICLGMNLMFTRCGAVQGLNLFEGDIVDLPGPHVTVPNMGWHPLHGLGDPFVYFTHGQGVAACPTATATIDHGGSWVAAVHRGRHTGFQFNPEKSGKAGLMLLHRWLNPC